MGNLILQSVLTYYPLLLIIKVRMPIQLLTLEIEFRSTKGNVNAVSPRRSPLSPEKA